MLSNNGEISGLDFPRVRWRALKQELDLHFRAGSQDLLHRAKKCASETQGDDHDVGLFLWRQMHVTELNAPPSLHLSGIFIQSFSVSKY